MTEPFPFGAQDEALVAVDDDGEPNDSRRNLIALGALAVVALGAGAFFFLGGSDAEEEVFAVPTRAPGVAATAAPAPDTAAVVPAASTVELGRNPFKALYVEPVAAPAETTDAGTTTTDSGTIPATTGSTGGTTPILIVDGGSTPNAPSSPTSSAQPKPAPAQSTVRLTSVSTKGKEPVATFVMDGTEHEGKEGDVLGGKLLVISLQQDNTGGWFANLQLGDGSPFEVHERQEVVVQ